MSGRGRLVFVLANVLGAAAFAWPLFAGAAPTGENAAHATDAPVLVALLVPLLVVIAVAEARRDGDARMIALLGALTAVNAVLRIPKGPSGEGVVFVLPILAGWFVGGRFAFLLGAFTIAVSALVTGGVGPWLPFQMFALGWAGLGAAGLRAALGGRAALPALGVWAVGSSMAYGFVMTLWFWPFLAPEGPVSFEAGAGVAANLARFAHFYQLTSLPWDTGRALFANLPLVLLLARPVGALLTRARERLSVTYAPSPDVRDAGGTAARPLAG